MQQCHLFKRVSREISNSAEMTSPLFEEVKEHSGLSRHPASYASPPLQVVPRLLGTKIPKLLGPSRPSLLGGFRGLDQVFPNIV